MFKSKVEERCRGRGGGDRARHLRTARGFMRRVRTVAEIDVIVADDDVTSCPVSEKSKVTGITRVRPSDVLRVRMKED